MELQLKTQRLFIAIVILLCFNCKDETEKKQYNFTKEKTKKEQTNENVAQKPSSIKTPKGMVWVAPKTFIQGAKSTDKFAMMGEKPSHFVSVDGFFIDITEVTNKQFKAFVDATNYITVAELPIDWEIMKVELPKNTKKPHDSILKPGSLIFNKNVNAVVSMSNYNQWWTWKIGANWKQPEGPNSSIEGKDNYPVVHIALQDAKAYCKWANRRLPTEAEWESAAQGNAIDNIFTWGNNFDILDANANTWQGTFPINNKSVDGFKFIAPTKSYPPNNIGLYDMLGNVWEITSDLFNINYYKEIDNSKTLINPKGASTSFNPNNPYQEEIVMKGGSFLCHVSYCASFRISARMGMSIDSGSDHTGFRTVATVDMITQ